MNTVVIISILFALAGSLMTLIDDKSEPLRELEKRAKFAAATSRDRSEIHTRLDEIGKSSARDYQDFRVTQYAYSCSGFLLVLLLCAISGKSLIQTACVSTAIFGCIYFVIDKRLSLQIKAHRESIEAQFPAIVEMMTLAIAAGETPTQAMLRIVQSADGELAAEFAVVISDIRAGSPLHLALDAMGRRVKSVMIRRFIDAIVTATLRGAPLIEVLSRHAIEARSNQRNRILNAAGKAEISMMIPVVFLILPISILFALWPSLTNLNLFAQ